jgi:hypothetical protein
VFDGQLGYLDYALANAALLPRVTGTTIWHINADEADLIDYDTTYKQDAQDALWAPDQYRASDHDPVIVGLDLDETAPDVIGAFRPLVVGPSSGLFRIGYGCIDDVDPNPSCIGDVNGISVAPGQRVYLIRSSFGHPWHLRIGAILFIKDTEFVLTVTGTDASGNTATVTAEPEFPPPHWGWRF